MPRYCSHTVILPDESRLDNFVVEVAGSVTAYYPFTGEVHSTIYFDTPILLSHRADLDGKTVSLTQLTWALSAPESQSSNGVLRSEEKAALYAYRLIPCPSCAGNRFTMMRL